MTEAFARLDERAEADTRQAADHERRIRWLERAVVVVGVAALAKDVQVIGSVVESMLRAIVAH